MNNDDTSFLPEQLDAQIEHPDDQLAPEDQQLLRDLKSVHQAYASQNAHSLHYVWQRLEAERQQQQQVSPTSTMDPGAPIPMGRKKQPMNYRATVKHPSSMPFKRVLTLLAAAIVVALVIGSATILFSKIAQHHVSSDPHKIQGTNVPVADSSGIYIVYTVDEHAQSALKKVDIHTHKQLWTYQHDLLSINTPIVVGNVVYLSAMDGQNKHAHLIALNNTTGKELWNVPFEGKDVWFPGQNLAYKDNLTIPAVADGQVFVLSRSGTVFSLDAKTGNVHWTYSTGLTGVGTRYSIDPNTGEQKSVGPIIHDGGTPVISNGVLYGTLQNTSFALNAQTGKQIWSHKIAGMNQVLTGSQVVNGVIYTASFEPSEINLSHSIPVKPAFVYAFNARDGSQIWRYPLNEQVGDTQVGGTPEVSNGHVYFVTNAFPNPPDFFTKNFRNTLYALDLQGHELWHKAYQAHISNEAPVVGEGYVSVSTQTYDPMNASPPAHKLCVYDAATGNGWEKVTPGDPFAIKNGILYTRSLGEIIAYDIKSQRIVWQERYSVPFQGDNNFPLSTVVVY